MLSNTVVWIFIKKEKKIGYHASLPAAFPSWECSEMKSAVIRLLLTQQQASPSRWSLRQRGNHTKWQEKRFTYCSELGDTTKMFMAPLTIKWRLFQKGFVFSVCHGKTLNVAIRQLRQNQFRAIVLVCCKTLAPLSWKLSSDSSDGGTSCANPAVGMRAVLEAGQYSSRESWFLNSWR